MKNTFRIGWIHVVFLKKKRYFITPICLMMSNNKFSRSLTLSQHSHGTALPQPAVLALPPHVHVHLTASATLTVIHSLLSHATPKETWSIQVKKRGKKDRERVKQKVNSLPRRIQIYSTAYKNKKLAKQKVKMRNLCIPHR